MSTKRVFLTGASEGIGAAVTARLSEHGYRIWGTSRDMARLPSHDNFSPLEMDLHDTQSIRTGVARALQQAGAFDVLVNNAGAGIFAPLEELSPEALRRQFQLLVFAPLELIKLLLPGMRESGRGLIINVTSLATVFPIPYMGAYSACKAAMSSLSWTLEMELCKEPVRVVEIRPGNIGTRFHESMERDASLDVSGAEENISRVYRAYTKRMKQAPSPDCIAQVVSDLIANDDDAPPQINAGSAFQSRIAPLLARIGPSRWTRSILKKYYGLKCRNS